MEGGGYLGVIYYYIKFRVGHELEYVEPFTSCGSFISVLPTLNHCHAVIVFIKVFTVIKYG